MKQRLHAVAQSLWKHFHWPCAILGLGLLWYGLSQFHPGLGPATVGGLLWLDVTLYGYELSKMKRRP